MPTEFYQVEDNITEINNHPPYPGDNNKWMIWDVNKHEYVESDIEVIAAGEGYQTKDNLTTSITAESTDEQYPSAKATYDAIQNAGGTMYVNVTPGQTVTADKTFAEMKAAIDSGKNVVAIVNGIVLSLVTANDNVIVFSVVISSGEAGLDYYAFALLVCSDDDVWDAIENCIETPDNKVTSLSAESTNVEYPSAKAVYDAIKKTNKYVDDSINSLPVFESYSFDGVVDKDQIGFSYNLTLINDSEETTTVKGADILIGAPIALVGRGVQFNMSPHPMVFIGYARKNSGKYYIYGTCAEIYNAKEIQIANLSFQQTDGDTGWTLSSYEEVHSNYTHVVSSVTDSAIDVPTSSAVKSYVNTKTQSLESTDNRTQTIDENSTITQYPSAKAVYDAIQAAKPDIVTPTAESTDTQAASAKAVWDMIGTGGSGTDISLGVTGASVGDIIKVKQVDADGKPTAWEAAELGMRLIRAITLAEQTDRVDITTDENGNTFSLNEVYCSVDAQSYTDTKERYYFLPNGGWGKSDPYITSSNTSTKSSDSWKNQMNFYCVYASGYIMAEQLPAGGSNGSLNSRVVGNMSPITKISVAGKIAVGCTIVVWGR